MKNTGKYASYFSLLAALRADAGSPAITRANELARELGRNLDDDLVGLAESELADVIGLETMMSIAEAYGLGHPREAIANA